MGWKKISPPSFSPLPKKPKHQKEKEKKKRKILFSFPPSLTPKSDYELFNCNNSDIRYWSWNYRGCWHQTCPPIVPRGWVWIEPIPIAGPCKRRPHRYFLSLPPRVGIGQFSRLLPSLDVVAVSQAPSPESNPNSPLPVIAMVGHYPTIES